MSRKCAWSPDSAFRGTSFDHLGGLKWVDGMEELSKLDAAQVKTTAGVAKQIAVIYMAEKSIQNAQSRKVSDSIDRLKVRDYILSMLHAVEWIRMPGRIQFHIETEPSARRLLQFLSAMGEDLIASNIFPFPQEGFRVIIYDVTEHLPPYHAEILQSLSERKILPPLLATWSNGACLEWISGERQIDRPQKSEAYMSALASFLGKLHSTKLSSDAQRACLQKESTWDKIASDWTTHRDKMSASYPNLAKPEVLETLRKAYNDPRISCAPSMNKLGRDSSVWFCSKRNLVHCYDFSAIAVQPYILDLVDALTDDYQFDFRLSPLQPRSCHTYFFLSHYFHAREDISLTCVEPMIVEAFAYIPSFVHISFMRKLLKRYGEPHAYQTEWDEMYLFDKVKKLERYFKYNRPT